MTLGYLFKHITHFHTNEKVIKFTLTNIGKFSLWLVASLLLLPQGYYASVISLFLALVILFPYKRNLILSFGSFVVLYKILAQKEISLLGTYRMGGLPTIFTAIVLVCGLLYLVYLAAKNYHRLPPVIQRNSQLSLHLCMWVCLIAASFIPRRQGFGAAALWITISCLPLLVWRCGYMLLAGKRGHVNNSRFYDHLFYLLPIYGGTNVPYGKGYDYLSQNASESPDAYVRAQLAGVKLLILSLAWKGAVAFINSTIYGDTQNTVTLLLNGYSLNIPRLDVLISSAPGISTSILIAWISLFLELITRTLIIAIYGHLVIGCLRLFGFNVFRNTYKPLLAQTVVEFWNRFFYYYKELLVEFFFFPVYLRFFKKWPKLRLFTATMVAVFFGNIYFHVLNDRNEFIEVFIGATWRLYAPRIFFAFLLSMGIYVSLLRAKKYRETTRQANTLIAKLHTIRRIAGVWLFYAIIRIWSLGPPHLTFLQRASFFLSLFGCK